MREERAKAAALESNVAVSEAAVEIEPHLSMEDINQQTRTLMRVTAGAASVIGMFWVWADVLPALTWLDGVTLCPREGPRTARRRPAAPPRATGRCTGSPR